jgi:hypothetical protein
MTPKISFGEILMFLSTAGVACAISLRRESAADLAVLSAAAHVTALALWACHLRWSGLGPALVIATLLGLGMHFNAGPAARLNGGALGEAVFLYVLLSLFAAYERQPGLQAIAAAALLMSAGILTKPPVAISCVLVGLTFFWQHRRQTHTGAFCFALLIFTPMTLCIFSAGILSFLTGSPLAAYGPVQTSAPVAPQTGSAGLNWLFFPLAVVLWRLVSGRVAASDIAFGLLMAAGTILSLFPWMPQPLRQTDLFYLATGGAAALFAQTACARCQLSDIGQSDLNYDHGRL